MNSAAHNSCVPCRYLLNLAIAMDEMPNAFLGGSPHETISSRLGRAEARGGAWAKRVCALLSRLFCQPDHCARSIIAGQYEAVDGQEEILDLGVP